MASNFADRIISAIQRKKSVCIVGIDPRLELLPQKIAKKYLSSAVFSLKKAAKAMEIFSKEVIDVVEPYSAGVKFQMAFFEMLGSEGFRSLERAVDFARQKNLIVILDGKRNDIGSTMEAYCSAYFKGICFQEQILFPPLECDAITVNPYLGTDAIMPFMEAVKDMGKGIFVLAKTSNPSSCEIQDLLAGEELVYEKVARLIAKWGNEAIGERGYSSVGAVVGATFPLVAKKLRNLLPNTLFLLPGFGAQGAKAEDLPLFFNKDGLGALVVSARSVIFAYKDEKDVNYQKPIERAIIRMREQINSLLKGL